MRRTMPWLRPKAELLKSCFSSSTLEPLRSAQQFRGCCLVADEHSSLVHPYHLRHCAGDSISCKTGVICIFEGSWLPTISLHVFALSTSPERLTGSSQIWLTFKFTC